MSDQIAPPLGNLGNYALIRLLGKGGFADVYLGEHVYLKTQAAIKVLHSQIAEDSLQGFINEAQTIGRLRHPHIIRVLDFGVQNNTPFLVMDYAPRGTLRQLHPRGSRLPLPTIVGYVRQIADALQYAHSQKLIHRDIKPENMLLGSNNEILLSDFGIATMAQSSRYQMTQDVVGTVSYMAPEQIQGKPRPASDEYALGIVIYEWLTGSCPFQGSFTEVATQHVFATPPPIREKFPTIPPDLEQVLLMALAKDPQQRFATLQAFSYAFEQACGGTPVPYPNTGTFIPGYTPDVSQSEMATFVRPPVVDVDQTRISGADPRVVGTSLGGTQLAGAYVQTPPPIQRPPSSPPRYTRRLLLGTLGGLAVAGGGLALFLVSHGFPRVIANPTPAPTAQPSPTRASTVNPTSAPNPTVNPATTSPATIQTYYIYHGPSKMFTAAWSPTNSAWIASAGQGSMEQVWDSRSGTNLSRYNSNSSIVYRLAWSPDSRYIVSGQYDGTVQIWNAATGLNIATYTDHTKQVNCVAWSPDGTMIASASADKTAKVWNVTTGQLITTYTGHQHYLNAVAWSPDSTRLVTGSGDNTAQVWYATSGQPILTYTEHTSEVLALAWAPTSFNGAAIASASDDTTVQVWDATSGTRHFTYNGHTDFVVAVAWSPDGTRLASGGSDTTVQVWSATTGIHLRTYPYHTAEVEGVTWSPDSTRVASASDDTTVRVWQAS